MMDTQWEKLRHVINRDTLEFIENAGIASAGRMVGIIAQIADRMIEALAAGEMDLIPKMERQMKAWMEVEQLYLSRQSFTMLRKFLNGVFNAAQIALGIPGGAA